MMFAVTERLLLRPGWPEDAPALARALANERIVRNLALLPWPYSERDARWFLENAFSPTSGEYLITLRESAEIIGGIGLHPDPENPAHHELGYWLAEAHWGRGYATEAARAVVANARFTQRLRNIRSAWFEDNPASGRVLEKVGFRRTGRVVQRHSVGRNALVPTVLMTLEDEAVSPTVRPAMQMQMAA